MKLSDKQHPTSYVMHASGAGAPGNARAQVTINLEPADDGKTNLTYSADAVIGGPVAGVGQRMITGVAKRMAGQFFTAIDDELTGTAAPVAAASPSAAAATASDASLVAGGAPVAAAPAVFAGKAGVPAGTSGDVQTLALGALGGALLTLIGVLGRLPPRPPIRARRGRDARRAARDRAGSSSRHRAPIVTVPTLRRASVPDAAAPRRHRRDGRTMG